MPENNQGQAAPQETAEPTLQEILQFDPFPNEGGTGDPIPETPAEGEESAEGSQETSGQSGEERAAAQQPTGAAAAEPPKPVNQADLQAAIRDMSQNIGYAVRAAIPPQPKAVEQPQNRFNLGVPDALVNALRSEDPREFSAGVGAMINGVANHVWTAFTEHLTKEILPNVPKMIENYVGTVQRQETVARDFYGTYPQLQIPELTSAIQTIGAQIAQEYAAQGLPLQWSPQLRDAIAERIFTRLPMLRTPPQQQQRGTRKSFATGNGARPAPVAETPQDDMMKMIFGG